MSNPQELPKLAGLRSNSDTPVQHEKQPQTQVDWKGDAEIGVGAAIAEQQPGAALGHGDPLADEKGQLRSFRNGCGSAACTEGGTEASIQVSDMGGDMRGATEAEALADSSQKTKVCLESQKLDSANCAIEKATSQARNGELKGEDLAYAGAEMRSDGVVEGKIGILSAASDDFDVSPYNDVVRSIKSDSSVYKKPKLETLMLDVISANEIPDIKITIGAYYVKCHVCVLKAFSEVFKELPPEVDSVSLPPGEVSLYAFQVIYNWIMEADSQLERAGLLEVLKAAQCLKMPELLDHIWQLLKDDQVQDDHCFVLYLEACTMNLPTVRKAMLERISKFFLTLVSSREYMYMGEEDVYHLLSSDSIAVNTEIEVLMAAARWLNFKWTDRCDYTLKMMGAVRFTQIPPWYLAQIAHERFDSIEMQRVLTYPKVNLLVHEALTVKYCLTVPTSDEYLVVPRKSICDNKNPFHGKTHNIEDAMYGKFVEYLEWLSTAPLDYFKHL